MHLHNRLRRGQARVELGREQFVHTLVDEPPGGHGRAGCILRERSARGKNQDLAPKLVGRSKDAAPGSTEVVAAD